MCLEMSWAGGFSLYGVPGYMGSNSVGLCRQGSEVTTAWGLLTELPAVRELPEPPVCKLLRLTLHSMQCPSSDPHSDSTQPLGGLGAAVVPLEATELGLD